MSCCWTAPVWNESALGEGQSLGRAWRTEVGSSLTAVRFYRKMGYEYKNGVTEADADGTVRLEKRNIR